MISSANRKVRIHITTYPAKDSITRKTKKKMDCSQNYNNGDKQNVCSICLNKTHHCGKQLAKSCPICRKQYTYDHKRDKINNNIDLIYRETVKKDLNNDTYRSVEEPNTKNVQTSQTDLTQDLSLLKEVLTVFQSKKQLDIKTNSKTVLMKDVSVETESKSKIDLKAKLTKSRIFQFSIEEGNKNVANNFKIVNYSQPNNVKASQYSIDLIKHKSSSIPQMKLEELKHSLKEKTKSKDAIEEVNRMFATVKRRDLSNIEEQNRPMIRNGPRVLPVVKTQTYYDNNKASDCEKGSAAKKLPEEKIKNNHDKYDEQATCKCCQTNNMQLSGGDSFFKHECCYHKMLQEGRCEKCVYMLCCHYKKHNKVETGAIMCECCKSCTNEKLDEKCDGNHWDRC